MSSIQFAKGHGTGNDFVIIVDRINLVPITADQVRWLCDRHFGLGADGVLRAVKASHLDEWQGEGDLWFMDYRNADGSIAEMCGNGLRVFARFLADEGLVDEGVEADSFPVATRAGVKSCQLHADGEVTVDLGRPRLTGAVEVVLDGRRYQAVGVDVGNPHAVVLLDPGTDLAGLPVQLPPTWQPAEAFPEGVNVEFVVTQADDRLCLRVHERGSGETLSCGTGIVAAVRAHVETLTEVPQWVRVVVPGGEVSVQLKGDQALLRGPAQIVAHGEVHLPEGMW